MILFTGYSGGFNAEYFCSSVLFKFGISPMFNITSPVLPLTLETATTIGVSSFCVVPNITMLFIWFSGTTTLTVVFKPNVPLPRYGTLLKILLSIFTV